nr:SPOR domain-containing protein [Alteromonas sp. C1M14]
MHDRLEYLVNYSSQLIFVSGDTVAQQKKTLESFVFQQQDETEIAYLAADSSMELPDYRRQLCRQLLGTLVGSFVRPLNELLAGLNEHVGPILITITQAEHIPDALLQELWDLVLQSRFAGNKQHLNVLLFGETAWAENAKQWLPAKNTDTPLLISSKSVAAQQPGSELDTMIENRRQAFHEHLAKRNGYDEQIETKQRISLGSPLFLSIIAILFLTVFGALIYWQYSDDIDALFNPIESNPPETLAVEPGSAYDQLQDEQAESDDMPVASWDEAVAAMDEGTPNAPVDDTDEDLLSFIENVSNDDPALNDATDTSQSEEPESVADSATSSLDEENGASSTDARQAKTIAQRAVDAIDSLPGTSTEIAPTPLSVSKPDFIAPTSTQQSTTEEQSAIQAADEKEALEEPSTALASTVEQEIAVTLPKQPASRAASPSPSEAPTENTALAVDAHDYDNETLLSLMAPKDYVIQLAGLKNEALMMDFVKDNNLGDHVWIYRTKRYGGDWFVLIYNQRFASFSQANAARTDLPPFQGKDKAFIKRGRNIIEEINVVAN